MPSTKTIGDFYEKKALDFLLNEGATLISKNYRYKKSEIDLIVKHKTVLLFVEVKYRSNNLYGYPEDWVSDSQKSRIYEAAENFINEENWKEDIRFDIIAFSSQKMLYFKDAF